MIRRKWAISRQISQRHFTRNGIGTFTFCVFLQCASHFDASQLKDTGFLLKKGTVPWRCLLSASWSTTEGRQADLITRPEASSKRLHPFLTFNKKQVAAIKMESKAVICMILALVFSGRCASPALHGGRCLGTSVFRVNFRNSRCV